MWNQMGAEIASQIAAAQSTADQRLQESMTERKEHNFAVLCKHSSELESTTNESLSTTHPLSLCGFKDVSEEEEQEKQVQQRSFPGSDLFCRGMHTKCVSYRDCVGGNR